jgi:WD40 repeat protein
MELTGSFIKALGICTAYRRNIQNPTSNPGATNLLVNPDDLRCNGLSFSENGRFLYSSHNDGVLRLFSGDASGPSTTSTSSSSSSANISSGNTSNSNSSEHDFYCKTDGCRLVTATHHELAVLHAASTPARKAPCAISYHNLHENKIVRQFRGHEGRVTSISMAPNADIFISCGLDAKYYLWDIRMPQPAAMGSFDATEDASTKFPPAQPQASFDTSGSVFAIAVPQRGLAMFDAMKIGLPLVNFNESRVPFQQLQSPLLVWSTKPMRLPTMPEDISPLPPAFPELASFVDMKFSPDENFIALSTSDRGILILDAFEPKEERAVLTSHAHDPNYPSSVSWSADSRFLLVGGCDGRLWAYDMTNPPPQPNTIDGDFPPSSWRPGHWEPQVLIVGENYLGHSASSAPYPPPLSTPESEAAGKAIKDAARKHKTDRYEKQQKSRQSFATSMNISIDAVFPQISASINPALAQSTDEMISRMDAPISHVRCHPTNAIFASASTKTISIWAPPLS